MKNTRFDVICAGSGPAGSTTALRLARAGFRVALVEARRFPRFKACGEFMSPECLPMLCDLGVDATLAKLGARRVRGMKLVHDGSSVVGRYRDVGLACAPRDHGYAIRRELLDDVLRSAALATGGVELFDGFTAVNLVRGSAGRVDGLIIRDAHGERTTLRAPWTIGADGMRSHVAGDLGVRSAIPGLSKVALTTRYAGVVWGDTAEVHFFDGGFVGCAPVDEQLVSVGLVVTTELFERDQLPRDVAFDAWLERLPAIGTRLNRGRRVDPVRGVGPMAWRTSQQTFDGAALVGDACGYVDPVTGEGIFFALRGAQHLAESLIPALHAQRSDRSALANYSAGRRRDIESRAAVALWLQRALRRPWLVRSALEALCAHPGLADLLVSVTGDYVPLRELVRPSVWLEAIARTSSASRVAAS